MWSSLLQTSIALCFRGWWFKSNLWTLCVSASVPAVCQTVWQTQSVKVILPTWRKSNTLDVCIPHAIGHVLSLLKWSDAMGAWRLTGLFFLGGKKKAEDILLDALENNIETSSRRGLHFLLIASLCHKGQGEHLTLPVTARSLGEGDINILSSASQQWLGMSPGHGLLHPPK